MAMADDIKKVSNRILIILQTFPQTRDSDKLLWLAYNCQFNGLKDVIKEGSYDAFKHWLLKADTPAFESLSRCRRKLQELHPELEGQKDQRMESEFEVRQMMLDPGVLT